MQFSLDCGCPDRRQRDGRQDPYNPVDLDLRRPATSRPQATRKTSACILHKNATGTRLNRLLSRTAYRRVAGDLVAPYR